MTLKYYTGIYTITMKKQNKRVSVSITKTVNTGNYESIRIHAGVSFDISDKTSLDKAYDEAFDIVTKQVVFYENSINEN